jgi:hypothetical protein
MDWTAVINTLIATLPAILIALGTLLVSLRTKTTVQQQNESNNRGQQLRDQEAARDETKRVEERAEQIVEGKKERTSMIGMKQVRAFALALALMTPVAGMTVLPGCASVGGVFQSDPVGATLKTMKDAYESSVRTAGRLYVEKVITEAQLRRFRDEANKFYVAYTKVVAAHEEAKLSPEDPRVKNLQLLLATVEALVASFTK